MLMPPLPSSLENCLEYAAEQHVPVELAALGSSGASGAARGLEHCRQAGRRVEKVGSGV